MILITLGNPHLQLPSAPRPSLSLLPAKRLAAVSQLSAKSGFAAASKFYPMRPLLNG